MNNSDKPTPCQECGIVPPGHKIDCKRGNERARKYQDGLIAGFKSRRGDALTILKARMERTERELNAANAQVAQLLMIVSGLAKSPCENTQGKANGGFRCDQLQPRPRTIGNCLACSSRIALSTPPPPVVPREDAENIAIALSDALHNGRPESGDYGQWNLHSKFLTTYRAKHGEVMK